jgi:Malectin domain
MTAPSPVNVEVEVQRAELRTVLSSQEFTRAPKLAQLLTYLCGKLFAGEASQIKEYSIGLEVFNRGASFDQDSDSIVRVEANRLRKRLAEYYAGEGASHALQITIPVGQYVPRFEPRNVPSSQFGLRAELALGNGIAEAGSDGARSWLRSRRILGASIVVLIAAVVWISFLVMKRRAQEKPVGETTARVQPEAQDGQFGPPSGEEIRILAGANRSLVDHAGKLWSADAGFTGGLAVKSAVQHIERAQDSGFYRTSRQGEFRYDIPLKSGVYELHLHFAETVYGPETTGTDGEGSRLMTVRANGKTLLSHFDVIGDAGESRMADVKVFTGVRPAADGLLHLEFEGEDGKEAMLSAIEILPGVAGQIRPVRILARQSPYYSNDSHWWSPDNYFEGGQLASYAQEVTGTDDPELYETERWGNFSYAIPVTPGRYSLLLHFAARRSNPGEPAPADRSIYVSRVFNVFCNGRTLLENFDLGREAEGRGDVVIKRFTAIEPNAQGKIMLSFEPVTGHATVSGIEVLPEGRE